MGSYFEGQIVWLTGGGSGLGQEMALEFARQGATVAVTGRREDRLNAVVQLLEEQGARGLAVPCDVTDDAAVKAAVETVVDAFGRIDVVVANAGFAVSGRVAELSHEEWRRQFDVNVLGLVSTIRHSMPELEKTSGRIGLVASVASFLSPAGSGAYCASKHAVRSIGSSLSAELAGSGVSCTTIHPGYVKSEIGRVDNAGQFQSGSRDKRPANLLWPTDKAARVMVRAIRKRKREYVFTWHGLFGVWMSRHFPRLTFWILSRNQRLSAR